MRFIFLNSQLHSKCINKYLFKKFHCIPNRINGDFVEQIPKITTSSLTSNKARILCNEACECPCNSLQSFPTLWKVIFTEGSSGVCVWGIGSKQNTMYIKQTQHHRTSGWKLISESILKFQNRSRIVGERIAVHQWIDFSLSPLIASCSVANLPFHHIPKVLYGLRSGDCGGHLSKGKSLSCSRNQSEMIWALWHGSLSCWK